MALPNQLFPKRKPARLEILLWGLRNLHVKAKALSLTVTVGGHQIITSPQPLTVRGVNKRTWINFPQKDQVVVIFISISRKIAVLWNTSRSNV